MYRLATERPVAVLMITTACALFGVLSYQQLGLALMPDLAHPTLTIRTEAPGAAPEEVEAEVTRMVEAVVGTVESLAGMSSSSRAGLSEVVLEFNWDADMDRVSQRVHERLARLEMPEDTERPLLLRYDPTLDPVMTLALSGDVPLTRLRDHAVDELSPGLSKLDGVARVDVVGGLVREVEVRLDEGRLAARGLSAAQVGERLAQSNVNLAGGTVKEGPVEFLVRTLAELRTPEEIARVVVAERDGVLIRVEDVGEVVPTTQERTVLARVDGREAVRLDIYREADANIVEVCDRVRAAVFGNEAQQAFVQRMESGEAERDAEPSERAAGDEARDKRARMKEKQRAALRQAQIRRQMTDFAAWRLPTGADVAVLGDQSTFIRAALDEVRGAALAGGLLAVIVLYLFLRSGFSTFIIGVAIPLSIAFTFVPLMLFDVSLNVMSLGGLALGIGMLVDNSVVVLESIFRCREEGDDIVEAAVRGAREVGAAVVASTLTTIAVFFPIVFVEGVAGQVFRDLALSVVFSMTGSLPVALFVVPMLASRQLGRADAVPEDAVTPTRWAVPIAAPGWWWGLRTRSLGPLRMILALPYMIAKTLAELVGSVLVAAFGALSGAVILLWKAAVFVVGHGLRPVGALAGRALGALDAGYPRLLRGALDAPFLVLAIAAVLGAGAGWSARQVGAELIPEVEQGVLEAEATFPIGTPLDETARRIAEVESRLRARPDVSRVESYVGAGDEADEEADRGPHSATLTLRLEPGADEQVVEAAVRGETRTVPDLEVELGRPALFSLRPPIRVVVVGHHLGQLGQAARRIAAAMERLPGISDLQSSVRPGYPEIRIAYDRDRLAALGLDARGIAERVRTRLEGNVATELRVTHPEPDRLDVRVRGNRSLLDTRRALGAMLVNPESPVPITLEAIAELDTGEGPAEIRRVEGHRAAVLTARTTALDLGTTAESLRTRLGDIPLPAGFELRLRGQDEEMERSLESLGFALLLAVFLVYVIMASLFESLRAPLVIMMSVPLAAIGVFYILWALQTPISVVVFLGLITLAGIVVNNAIVLVDYAGQLRSRGRSLTDALVEAGRVRLRPILMTTTTTVLGLLPMAIGGGEGAELRQPMALTLIGGLTCSTLLTLVVVPVVYRIVVGGRISAEVPGPDADGTPTAAEA
jgi:HAE1 family hydrophobic/amphiphilic exporter-1